MKSLRMTGTWFCYLMVALFFLLLSTASLSLLGFGNVVLTPLHKMLGIVFSCFFLMHLLATGHHAIMVNRKKYQFGTTIYHNLNRSHSLHY